MIRGAGLYELRRYGIITVPVTNATVAKNDGGGWFNRWLFKLVRQFDYNAWIKLKYRGDYDSIAPEDQPYYRPTPVESLARLVRRGWRTVTFRQYRKARRRARESGSG